MSFEVFNYSPTLAEIDRTIAGLNERINIRAWQRLDIARFGDNPHMVIPSDGIFKAADCDRDVLSELIEIKSKIRALLDLPAVVKSQLYQLYLALGVRLEDYAARLPVCYEGLIFCLIPMMESGKPEEKIRAEYQKYTLLRLPQYYSFISAAHTL